MHEYILTYHDRKLTYYVAATISGVIGVIITFAIGKLSVISGKIIAGPSGLAVFTLILLGLDHALIKCSIFYRWGLVKIPNLNGVWSGKMSSSNNKNQTIDAKITIHQTYTKIRVRLETDKSRSMSRMASIEMEDPKCFKLRYEYSAEYSASASEIHRHHGVTELVLISDDHLFDQPCQAKYYTELRRDTHGQMEFVRKK
ncbi:hypothetical protein PAQ31011_00655 [Pandoraea aquatica]|uniref:CD-NTase-associated protein 15 domain-containing protein n=1 Tax=Pandoraea aquatica TaxID=2508290 RepID=A0A5E4S8G1_9BURK|nr:hypothetical protein PAQ31011_00655 [Pandoraea aquatica]